MNLVETAADEAGIRALRKLLARHNRHVLFLVLSTVAVAAAMWTALYFGLYWLALLALTVVRGADAAVPPGFLSSFASGAVGACLFVWLARRRWPDERPRDHKSPFETAADILLAVPRTTLTAWDTLSAFQFLSDTDLSSAWQLLRRLGKTPTLPVHSVPLELPEPIAREKILLALQVAGLIEFQRRADAPVLTLRDEQARALSRGKIRIGPRPRSMASS